MSSFIPDSLLVNGRNTPDPKELFLTGRFQPSEHYEAGTALAAGGLQMDGIVLFMDRHSDSIAYQETSGDNLDGNPSVVRPVTNAAMSVSGANRLLERWSSRGPDGKPRKGLDGKPLDGFDPAELVFNQDDLDFWDPKGEKPMPKDEKMKKGAGKKGVGKMGDQSLTSANHIHRRGELSSTNIDHVFGRLEMCPLSLGPDRRVGEYSGGNGFEYADLAVGELRNYWSGPLYRQHQFASEFEVRAMDKDPAMEVDAPNIMPGSLLAYILCMVPHKKDQKRRIWQLIPSYFSASKAPITDGPYKVYPVGRYMGHEPVECLNLDPEIHTDKGYEMEQVIPSRAPEFRHNKHLLMAVNGLATM